MKRTIVTTLVVLTVLLSLLACADIGGNDNSQAQCKPEYSYDNLSNKGEALEVVDQEQDTNASSSPEDVTFSSQRSGTVSTSLNIHVEADFVAISEAVFVHVHGEINASISRTLTASIGNQTHLSVPGMAAGYGDYGVYVQMASGHLYTSNCPGTRYDWGNVFSYTPEKVGWCTWIRGPDVFVDGSQSPCKVVTPGD